MREQKTDAIRTVKSDSGWVVFPTGDRIRADAIKAIHPKAAVGPDEIHKKQVPHYVMVTYVAEDRAASIVVVCGSYEEALRLAEETMEAAKAAEDGGGT